MTALIPHIMMVVLSATVMAVHRLPAIRSRQNKQNNAFIGFSYKKEVKKQVTKSYNK